MNRGEPQN